MSFYLGDCFKDVIFESAFMIVFMIVVLCLLSCSIEIVIHYFNHFLSCRYFYFYTALIFLISKSSLPVLSIWIGVCSVKVLSYCSLHAKFYSSKRWWWLLLHAYVCGVEMYAMFFCRENVCTILFSNCLRIWCIAELNS